MYVRNICKLLSYETEPIPQIDEDRPTAATSDRCILSVFVYHKNMAPSIRSSLLRICLNTCTAGLYAFLTVLFVLGSSSAGTLPGEWKIASPGGYEPLSVKAGRPAGVRLIVKVDSPFSPMVLPESADSLLQMDHIARAQDDLLSSLALYKPGSVHKFRYVPYLVLEADPAALKALLASPRVIEVREDAPEFPALDVSLPLIGASSLWSWYGPDQGFDGSGVAVAVLDTGVDKDHPFLSGAVVSEACYSTNNAADFAQSLCPGGVSHSTAPGSAMPYGSGLCTPPKCDHGTHVAGIVAGRQGVAGSPGPGVAPGAGIIAIQVFSLIGGQVAAYQSDTMKGLERVYDLRSSYNISSVNMSFGGSTLYPWYCDTDPRKPLIDILKAAGVAAVVSSGNNNSCGSITAPACISSVISVGATDDSDSVGPYSNSAAFMSLLAPGTNINSSVPGGTYQNMSGTSMAAPHVSGAWALMKQARPGQTVDQVLAAFTSTGPFVTDNLKCPSVTKKRISVLEAFNNMGSSPSAETLPAAGISQTSAVLNGRVNANNVSTAVAFEYGTTIAYGSNVAAVQSPVGGTALTHVDQTITGLSENTLYHFRVKVDNGSVVSYGADMTFTTKGPCASISDGGFEAGSPSAYWTEASMNFGTPLCTSFVCGGAGPRTGAWWAWFGGIAGTAETSSLTQDIVIPRASSPRLEFYLWNDAAGGSGADIFRVTVDGSEIFSALEGNPIYSTGYYLTGLDLSSYADDGSHALSFLSNTTGSGLTNFNLDDVSITCGPATTLPLVSTGPATSVGATGAALNGTVNANNSNTAVRFEYGNTTTYGNTISAVPSPVAGSVDTPVGSTIAGLAPNTTYHFRAIGSNATGISYGRDMTFTTLLCASGDVRIGNSTYPTVTAAIAAVGDANALIEAKALDFAENLTFAGAGRITLKGGYDCAFASNAGFTAVTGTGAGPTVSIGGSGSVIVENFIVK